MSPVSAKRYTQQPVLVEKQVRITKEMDDRLAELAAAGGLTASVLFQAIIILDMFHNGWIKVKTPDPRKAGTK